MNTKTKILCQLVFAVLGLAVFASANGIPVTFVGGSGGPSSSGVYYYPYTLNVNGTNVTVACDDYSNEVYNNETWNVTEEFFTGTNDSGLSGAMFYNGTSNSVTLYEEAAWLYSQFQATPPTTNTVNEAINYAMWDLFDNAAPSEGSGSCSTNDTTSCYWLNQAAKAAVDNFAPETGFNTVDFADFVIYTPVNGSQDPHQDGEPQEYIGELPPAPVPEPGTVLLFVTGLAGLGLLEWKRRQALG